VTAIGGTFSSSVLMEVIMRERSTVEFSSCRSQSAGING
jgi:hypothetical protein